MANSDGHKGRPGSEGPGAGHFGIFGGLTCVLASELTRKAVFEALKTRRCYGTTGPRMAIDLSVNGQPMGWVGSLTKPAVLKATIQGTCPIEKVEVFRGLKLAKTFWNPAFPAPTDCLRIRVLWKGARHRGRGRRITWNGTVSVTGSTIIAARTVAFDSPGDGITNQSPSQIQFRSQTTGDSDGIELEISPGTNATITLETPEGTWSVNTNDTALNQPQGRVIELGSLERRVTFQRYPDTAQMSTTPFDIELPLEKPTAPHTPWYVKVTQSDGHLAWTSPVYLRP